MDTQMSRQNRKTAASDAAKPRKPSQKIIPPQKTSRPKKAVLVESLFSGEVERLKICVRLASYGTLEEFFASCARCLIADFEAEYPGLFKIGREAQLQPGALRVLRALRNGHCTVAEIRQSLLRNPLKDSVIRAALKQLVELGIARKGTQAEKHGAGRPVEIFTLVGE
jgi:hypothetical protein